MRRVFAVPFRNWVAGLGFLALFDLDSLSSDPRGRVRIRGLADFFSVILQLKFALNTRVLKQ